MNGIHKPILPVFLLSLALMVTSGCKEEKQPGIHQKKPPEVSVQAAEVKEVDASYQIEIMGTVAAVNSTVIATKVSGNIVRLPVQLGSRVAQGDILVELDAGELTARLEQAEAQLRQANRNLKREKDLLKKRASTPETVKNMEDLLRITKARLKEAETMIEYTKIKAPYSGTITKKFVNTGDLITPGKPLVQLEDATDLQVLTNIPESLLASINEGSELQIKINSSDSMTKGKVKEIAPTVHPQTRTALVKIGLEKNEKLLPGNFVRVSIPKEREKALVIPKSALFKKGQLEQVFILDKNRAKLRIVRSGMVSGDFVEILSGVEKGERVLFNLSGKLGNNQPVILQ